MNDAEVRESALIRLRVLLDDAAVHDPPWHDKYDGDKDYITAKSGPGWYDNVADEVSNPETAALIVAAVNALPDLLEAVEAARDYLAATNTLAFRPTKEVETAAAKAHARLTEVLSRVG